MTSVIPCSRSSSMMCSMHGLPTIGTIGFGWFDVSGRSRVPSPPAITTAFIARPSLDLPLRLEHVLDERDRGEREPDPEDHKRPRRAVVGHHHEDQRRVEEPGCELADEV